MTQRNVFHSLVVSTAVAFLVRLAIFHIPSNWNSLTSDVGVDGAWMVATIFSILFGVSTSVGTLFFLITLILLKAQPNLAIVGISSGLTIISTITAATLFNTFDIYWLVYFGGVAVMSWLINFIAHSAMRQLNKAINPTH